MNVLGHLSEFETKLLLSSIVEVAAKEGGDILLWMQVFPRQRVIGVLRVCRLAFLAYLSCIKLEKVNLTNYYLVCKRILCRDWILLVVP